MPRETNEKQTSTQGIDEIIDAYGGELAGFIQSRIASAEEAEDLLQETWYQLSKTLSSKTLRNPRAWVYQVARNKIIDSYRKKSVDWLEDYLFDEDEDGYLREVLLEADDSPELAFLQEQFWTELYEALDILPENQREVFVLNELEGLTLREIAERTGEKLKTIISRKGYAMRQLRMHLQDVFEEFVGE